jgi:hypothetical protein
MMKNSHDEIKNLLKASRKMLTKPVINEEINRIKSVYGIITEQGVDLTDDNVTDKINVTKSIENTIDDDMNSKEDKKQGYRISGGIVVLHGKEQTDLELTTDEKNAFQETMDEFIGEVSNMVDFNKLNVYQNNVEWSGKIIDFDIEFLFSIGEENGLYINADMTKVDDNFLELMKKMKSYYDKFKQKWATVLSSRKKTKKTY